MGWSGQRLCLEDCYASELIFRPCTFVGHLCGSRPTYRKQEYGLECPKPQALPGPLKGPLIESFWPLIVDIWGILEGSFGGLGKRPSLENPVQTSFHPRGPSCKLLPRDPNTP